MTKKVKTVFIFPDECIKCEYKVKFGEDVCSICKISKSVNADKVIITTTVNME